MSRSGYNDDAEAQSSDNKRIIELESALRNVCKDLDTYARTVGNDGASEPLGTKSLLAARRILKSSKRK